MLENLLMGFQVVLQWSNLLALLAGTLMGYFVGAVPGLTPTVGIALLIPFTFGMDPVASIVMLVGLYMAAEYGGGITAILVNAPGTPAAAATAFDGYPLAKQGKAGKALGISIISSGIGAFVSSILLILFAVPLANFALQFGPPEYFALAVFGLSVVAGLSAESWLKGLLAVAMGLLVTTIGLDPITGITRYTFINDLMEGVPFVPALIGLFAVSEVLMLFEETKTGQLIIEKAAGALPTLNEIKSCASTIARGIGIGYIIGMIPGAGATIASFVSYNEAKRASKNPEKFGTGVIQGIAASESANNSAVAGVLVPLLTLGIPGSASAAVLIGALTIHGLQPGPLLFTKHPEVPYSVFACLLIAAPIMLSIGLGGAKLFAKVTLIPKSVLASVVLCICFLGAYSFGNSMFPVWVAFISGIIGYVLRKFGFPTAPVVLALVLGYMAESNFRRALLMGEGSYTIFFARPLSLVILILAVLSFGSPFVRNWLMRRAGQNVRAKQNA
ncbi:MAG: putative tricarboxylic transport rane protein [Clostridia bacterium]|nr:putative tricarboxylic transport rane protein [Clostridia bacterium]